MRTSAPPSHYLKCEITWWKSEAHVLILKNKSITPRCLGWSLGFRLSRLQQTHLCQRRAPGLGWRTGCHTDTFPKAGEEAAEGWFSYWSVCPSFGLRNIYESSSLTLKISGRDSTHLPHRVPGSRSPTSSPHFQALANKEPCFPITFFSFYTSKHPLIETPGHLTLFITPWIKSLMELRFHLITGDSRTAP